MKKLFIISIIVGVFCAFLNVNAWAAGSSANSGSTAILDSENFAGAQINSTDNSKNTVYNREFVLTPGAQLPPLNPFMADHPDSEDSSFRTAGDLVKFGNVFSESAMKNLLKGGDVEFTFPVLNTFAKPDNTLADGQRYIMIVLSQPIDPDNFKMSAPVDAYADDSETTSFQVIAKLALEAIKNGDNVLYLVDEGWLRKVEASGHGIGTYVTGGAVSDTGKVSGVGGGGFGWATNQTGPESRPWVMGYSGSIQRELNVVFAPAEIAKKRSSNTGNPRPYDRTDGP